MLLARVFPALGAGYLYLLRVLIGSFYCLRLLWLASDYFRFGFTDAQLKTALTSIIIIDY